MAEAGEGDLDYTENEEVVCQRGKLKAIIEELKEVSSQFPLTLLPKLAMVARL